jgi:hypothetical protein
MRSGYYEYSLMFALDVNKNISFSKILLFSLKKDPTSLFIKKILSKFSNKVSFLILKHRNKLYFTDSYLYMHL